MASLPLIIVNLQCKTWNFRELQIPEIDFHLSHNYVNQIIVSWQNDTHLMATVALEITHKTKTVQPTLQISKSKSLAMIPKYMHTTFNICLMIYILINMLIWRNIPWIYYATPCIRISGKNKRSEYVYSIYISIGFIKFCIIFFVYV